MTRDPDPHDYLADALSEDVVDAPAARLLAEATEDAGDAGAVAAAFDRVAARAGRQARRRRIAGRIRALAAALAAPRARPAMAAVAGLAVIAVAGDLYLNLHVRPGPFMQASAPTPAAAPPPAAQDLIAARPAQPPDVERRADIGDLAPQTTLMRAAPAPAAPAPAAPTPAAPAPAASALIAPALSAPPSPAPAPPVLGSAGSREHLVTTVEGGARVSSRARPAAAADRLQALLDYELALGYGDTEKAATRPSSAAGAPDFARTQPGAPLAFDWPLRGRLLAGFRSSAVGQRNDGIDVAAPTDSDIRAAADGVVVYAGGDIAGYGNMILVRHRDDFITVYAHASRLLVKRDDAVRRGQVIAKSGRSGDAGEPRLHFEIRKSAAPVDPARYLPPEGPATTVR
jgi:murein DD-endopeptidase MepM/ murein hydrolase activator NlpD